MYKLNFNEKSYELSILESFINGFVVEIKDFDYKRDVCGSPFGDICFHDGSMTITNPNGSVTKGVSGHTIKGHDCIFSLKFNSYS